MFWHVNDDPVAYLQVAEVRRLSALIEGRLGGERQRFRGLAGGLDRHRLRRYLRDDAANVIVPAVSEDCRSDGDDK
jgi:hypothetical protein